MLYRKKAWSIDPFLDAFKYSLAPTELQDRWKELDSYVYVISNRWDQKPATDKDRHLDPQWADSDERTIVSYSIYRIYLFVSDERQPSVNDNVLDLVSRNILFLLLYYFAAIRAKSVKKKVQFISTKGSKQPAFIFSGS